MPSCERIVYVTILKMKMEETLPHAIFRGFISVRCVRTKMDAVLQG